VEKYRKIFQKNTSEIFRNFPEKYEIFRTIFPPHITIVQHSALQAMLTRCKNKVALY